MTRVSQRLWIGLLALVLVWVVAYWLTPSPAGPVVSTPGELRQAADRAEQAEPPDRLPEPGGPGPIVTVAGRPDRGPTASPDQDMDPALYPALDPALEIGSGVAGAGSEPGTGSGAAGAGGPAIIPPTFQIYTVASGDTMSSVAERFYGTPLYAGQIARANPTVDPVRLRVGTELKIPTDPRNIQGIPADPALQPGDPEPAFIEYVVANGDTLSEIARALYGRSSLWTHIRDANPQINRDATNIRPGMTIRIPPPPPPR